MGLAFCRFSCFDGFNCVSLLYDNHQVNDHGKMIASNKFASILSTSVIIGLLVIVLILMFNVRTLYHDHMKLNRLREYKAELDSIASHFDSVHEDIKLVGNEFQAIKNHGHRVWELQRTRISFRTGKFLSEVLLFAEPGENMLCTKIVWMSETISVHNMYSPGLGLEFSCNELVIQWTICRHIVG